MTPGSDMRAAIRRLFDIRRGEVVPVLLAMAFFFCILTALMVLRPARDALGMQRGIEAVRWLFVGTAVVTLVANPVFGWLVSRYRRLRFITVTYLFFALSLLGFYLLLVAAPAAVGSASGQVFYVWFSVSNLFVTMVFWALMADRFTLEQARRSFALIAVGGTLGAIFGPWLAAVLARPLGTPALLLVAIGFLLLGVGFAWALAGWPRRDADAAAVAHLPGPAREDVHAIIGGSAWQGFKAVFRSRYLAGIAGYLVIMTIMSTFLYFTRLQLVAELGDDVDLRASIFGRIDLITQVATLLVQVLIAGRLMKRLGVHVVLALLPLTAMLGFIGLAMVGSLAALIAFEAAFRAVQRALARPARETLYTVVSREDKYKSKAFIDTFVYRGGDVLGAQLEGGLGRLGLGLGALASVAVPLAIVWAVLGIWLGRRQLRLAAAGEIETTNPVAITRPYLRSTP
ncbi:MAG: MFS transporter [Xanthomonadales bacterium]|nr:MFS transporter [Xanthomonadales bacterium]